MRISDWSSDGFSSDRHIRVQEAEIAANEYARRNGIVNQTTGAGANDFLGAYSTFYGPTVTGSNLANVNDRYVRARAERIVAEQRWMAIAKAPPEPVREVQSSLDMPQLETTKADLKRTEWNTSELK